MERRRIPTEVGRRPRAAVDQRSVKVSFCGENAVGLRNARRRRVGKCVELPTHAGEPETGGHTNARNDKIINGFSGA